MTLTSWMHLYKVSRTSTGPKIHSIAAVHDLIGSVPFEISERCVLPLSIFAFNVLESNHSHTVGVLDMDVEPTLIPL